MHAPQGRGLLGVGGEGRFRMHVGFSCVTKETANLTSKQRSESRERPPQEIPQLPISRWEIDRGIMVESIQIHQRNRRRFAGVTPHCWCFHG